MQAAAAELKGWPAREVQVFHHNDSDGLSSGAILTRAFQRAGYRVRRSCLEKPYPKLLHRIFEQSGGLIVFADFAGRIAPLLSELNRGRNLALILDHHVAVPATDPRVHNLDPDLHGLKGDRDISGSTTCYLFAKTLDAANADLAHVAAIGAVGDGFFVEGRLAGENRQAAVEARGQGTLEIQEEAEGERYFLKTAAAPADCAELGAYLDTLGAAGYYRGGPDLGVEVCLEGSSTRSDRMLRELQVIQRRAFEAEIDRLRGGELRQSAHIQWFHVQNRFAPMGVKMIGVFCEAIKDTDLVDPNRYVAGFQIIPNEIPGFGPMRFDEVKISMRASAPMEAQIRAGAAMGLNVLLPEATGRVGGFSDACHSLTAATTVAIGMEQRLIDEMEKILPG